MPLGAENQTEHNPVSVNPEDLRKQHNLRPITAEEDGDAIAKLPNGIYGFTSSPGLPDTPVYGKRIYQGFEMHKRGDGSMHLLGFLSPRDAALLRAGKQFVDIQLYPEPWEQATEPASVDLNHVIPSRKGASRSNGNYLRLGMA